MLCCQNPPQGLSAPAEHPDLAALKVLEKRPASLLRLVLGSRREEQQLLSSRQTSLLGKPSPYWQRFLRESRFPSLSLQAPAMDAMLHTVCAVRLSNHVLSHLPGRGRLTNWSGRGFFIKGKLFWWDNSNLYPSPVSKHVQVMLVLGQKRCGAELQGAPR